MVAWGAAAMQGVCVALGRCRAPGDQGGVEQVVAKISEGVPGGFVGQGHHKALGANGLCRVRCIRGPTKGELQHLGVSMGGPMATLGVLHAGGAPGAGAAAGGGAPTRVGGGPGARPPPGCGPTKHPGLGGWGPYKTGLRLCVGAGLAAAG